jgi:hypothetical protein
MGRVDDQSTYNIKHARLQSRDCLLNLRSSHGSIATIHISVGLYDGLKVWGENNGLLRSVHRWRTILRTSRRSYAASPI